MASGGPQSRNGRPHGKDRVRGIGTDWGAAPPSLGCRGRQQSGERPGRGSAGVPEGARCCCCPASRDETMTLCASCPPFCGALLQPPSGTSTQWEGGFLGSRGSPLFSLPRVQPSSAAASPSAPCVPAAQGEIRACTSVPWVLSVLGPSPMSASGQSPVTTTGQSSGPECLSCPETGLLEDRSQGPPQRALVCLGRARAGRQPAGAGGADGELGKAAGCGPWGQQPWGVWRTWGRDPLLLQRRLQGQGGPLGGQQPGARGQASGRFASERTRLH